MNLYKELGWRCRSVRPVHHTDILGLVHLYQPIIGAAGVSLYLTLYYQLPLHREGSSPLYQHSFLLRLGAMSLQEMLEARFLLEGVGLLNCFEKNEAQLGPHYEYEVIPPLSPKRFFQSDVLSVSLYNRLGKEKFGSLRRQLVQCDQEEKTDVQVANITRSFQEVFKSSSCDQLEQTAKVAREIGCLEEDVFEGPIDGKYPEYKSEFDFSLIKMRLGNVVSDDAWTDQLLYQLREISFLYQLDELDLLKALQNPYISQKGTIDMQRLRSFVKSEYCHKFTGAPVVSHLSFQSDLKENNDSLKVSNAPNEDSDKDQRHAKQLSAISPLELLSHFQGGAKVPQSDIELVDALVDQYKLPFGVINVLLEYVLFKYDYRLPRSLVEKIAGHWKRLGIATVEEAMIQARKEDWSAAKRKSSSNRRGTKKEPAPLPKAVAKQFERKEAKIEQEKKYDPVELEKRKARIQAKLKMMQESQGRRMREKESLS